MPSYIGQQTVECVGCGTTLDLHDTMDANPPIPYSAWPERWSLDNGEGGALVECPECGLDADTVLAKLPPYPWAA